jgi:hypothetical protein
MKKPDELKPDHRKLISVWIEEETKRREQDERLPQLPIEEQTTKQIEDLCLHYAAPLFPAENRRELEKKAKTILESALKDRAAKREMMKLPSQFERDQQIMNFKSKMPGNKTIISPNAMEKREDIFIPRVRKEAETQNGVNNQEGNPDVNRVENWSIWCYAWGMNGGDACWSSLYWRYRIWVPSFDTSIQPDRRLVVDPMAVLSGHYELYGFYFPFLSSPNASVFLRFWTGTWHWHYTGSGYEPEWTGWKRSHTLVDHSISYGNLYQNVAIPYPGTQVRTPARFDPPGVHTDPNPINYYGSVLPNDVVDFYVKPEICAMTSGMLSYAKIDFALIDVPFVTAAFETGYYL